MLRENLAQHMLFGHVAIGHLIADPLGTDAAGVVLHLPVQNVQFDSGNPGTGHFFRGVGNEAAILSAVAFSGHLYPRGAGGRLPPRR